MQMSFKSKRHFKKTVNFKEIKKQMEDNIERNQNSKFTDLFTDLQLHKESDREMISIQTAFVFLLHSAHENGNSLLIRV